MQLSELTSILNMIQINLEINGHMNTTINISDCKAIIITSNKKLNNIIHSPFVNVNDYQLIIKL